jgi:hypothetical protein
MRLGSGAASAEPPCRTLGTEKLVKPQGREIRFGAGLSLSPGDRLPRLVLDLRSVGPSNPGHGPLMGPSWAPSQPSASEVVGRERRFASLHDGNYIWRTVPRLRHQARGDTTLGLADLFGGEDLLFP